VRSQGSGDPFGEKAVEGRGVGCGDGVELVSATDADPVEHDEDERADWLTIGARSAKRWDPECRALGRRRCGHRE
jgi:hypothetical protein